MSEDLAVINLTKFELQSLTFALGFATGAAFANHDEKMAYGFLKLANMLNADNPDWSPYKIPVIENGDSPAQNTDPKSH